MMKKMMLFLYALAVLRSQTFAGAGTYSKTVFYNDVSVGAWSAVSNVDVQYATGGIYTNGTYTNYWRINGTNLQGRLPISCTVTSLWTGTTNTSNAVVISWSPKDGIMKYVIEKSDDNNTWTNWITAVPGVTNFTDLGTNFWTISLFTNLFDEISPPSVPWSDTNEMAAHISASGTNVHGLGTASTSPVSAFATAVQGTNADAAFGWGNHATNGYLTTLSGAMTNLGAFTEGTSNSIAFADGTLSGTWKSDSNAFYRDGTRAMTGDLNMGGYSITNIADFMQTGMFSNRSFWLLDNPTSGVVRISRSMDFTNEGAEIQFQAPPGQNAWVLDSYLDKFRIFQGDISRVWLTLDPLNNTVNLETNTIQAGSIAFAGSNLYNIGSIENPARTGYFHSVVVSSVVGAGTNIIFTGGLVPSISNAFDVGSTSKPVRHIFAGPGSIYLDGLPVLTSVDGRPTLSTNVIVAVTPGNTNSPINLAYADGHYVQTNDARLVNALTNAAQFATAAQGALADTAVQSTGGVINGAVDIIGDTHVQGNVTVSGSIIVTNLYVTNLWTTVTNLDVQGSGLIAGNLTVQGTNTSGYFEGNGAGLTNLVEHDTNALAQLAVETNRAIQAEALLVPRTATNGWTVSAHQAWLTVETDPIWSGVSNLYAFTNDPRIVNAITNPPASIGWTNYWAVLAFTNQGLNVQSGDGILVTNQGPTQIVQSLYGETYVTSSLSGTGGGLGGLNFYPNTFTNIYTWDTGDITNNNIVTYKALPSWIPADAVAIDISGFVQSTTIATTLEFRQSTNDVRDQVVFVTPSANTWISGGGLIYLNATTGEAHVYYKSGLTGVMDNTWRTKILIKGYWR